VEHLAGGIQLTRAYESFDKDVAGYDGGRGATRVKHVEGVGGAAQGSGAREVEASADEEV